MREITGPNKIWPGWDRFGNRLPICEGQGLSPDKEFPGAAERGKLAAADIRSADSNSSSGAPPETPAEASIADRAGPIDLSVSVLGAVPIASASTPHS